MVVRNVVQGNPKKGVEGQQSFFNQKASAASGGATRAPYRADRPPQERQAATSPQPQALPRNTSGSPPSGASFRKRHVVNKVMLEGRLGRDPDLKQTQGGQPFAKFTLATQESYKDGSGEWQKRTQWHRIRAWGEIAEAVAKHLRKGSYVHVEGKLSTNEWVDKQNNKRSSTEVVATGLRFLDAVESTISVPFARSRDEFGSDASATEGAPPAEASVPA